MIVNKQLVLIKLILAITLSQLQAQNFPGKSVFPGVTGFGTDTKGGYGGRIIRVTTLSRDGAGSLSEAIRARGPRIVVFEVAGTIDLARRSLGIINPYITIAGQTAPYPGITLVRGSLNIGTCEVIVQHIRVRPGEAGNAKMSGWEADGISTVGGAWNVIIDHCSLTWATDENLSASGPQFEGDTPEEWRQNTSHKIVFSNCIIAEGLSNSTHSKGEHSKGTLVHDNVTDILILKNLFASNVERNPLFSGGSQGLVINNYISNPKEEAIHYALAANEWGNRELIPGIMGIIGNVIETGPDTRKNLSAGSFKGPVKVYWEDNRFYGNPGVMEITGEFTKLNEVPFWPEGLRIMQSDDVKEYVLENAGAFPWQRDSIDQQIIERTKNETLRIINSERDAGGYPETVPVFRKFERNNF